MISSLLENEEKEQEQRWTPLRPHEDFPHW